jgi:TolB protein
MSDPNLKDILGDLAEGVRDVDLYDRAVTRSRRIGRNHAIARTGSLLALAGLAGFALWQFPRHPDAAPPPVAASVVASPSTSPSGTPSQEPSLQPSHQPSASGTTPSTPTLAVPRSRSLADIPGQVFYQSIQDSGVRLRNGEQEKFPTAEGAVVAVSPDGSRIAYVTQEGRLHLSGQPDPIHDGEVNTAAQTPAWSPDGTKLLIAAPRPGVLTVADGSFTALPKSLAGQHFRWSGDGSKLVYGSTSSCRLKTADADGSTGRTVPGLGAPGNAENPEQVGACWVFSVNRSGSRAAVPISDVDGGDHAVAADTVVNTATGAIVPIPVEGLVIGVLYGPDGNMLVRTSLTGGNAVLSVFDSNGTLLVQAGEPKALRGMDLVGYSR